MLTPEYLTHAPEGAEAIAEDLHIDILQRLIFRIMLRFSRGDGYILTAQDKYQIETLEQMGYLAQDIQKALARATGRMQTEIAAAMEDAGVRVLQYDDALYEVAGLSPPPIRQSPYITRLMQSTYEQTMGEWRNATATTAEAAQKTFVNACDKAYYQVMSGAMAANQAVKEAVDTVVSSGVTVTYPTGHQDTIETATARAVRTGISQGAARIQLARMNEMGIDLVLVSSHLGARPEHALWQGKVYSLGGEYKGQYPDFEQSTGFGTVTGLCGANCRHSFNAWFPGMENPWKRYDTEENRKEYEKEQRQRSMERKIRKTKREVMGYREAMEDAKDEGLRGELEKEYQRRALRLQQQNAAYSEYCKDNGLKKQSDRISIAQWDRQQSAKATAAANQYKKELENQARYGKMVAELKGNGFIPKNAAVHIPPREMDVKSLSFDDYHINTERSHNVTREMAETWIQESKVSLTVWNGIYERYYSSNGAAYVNMKDSNIRTAFPKEEFDEKAQGLMEVLEKYGY